MSYSITPPAESLLRPRHSHRHARVWWLQRRDNFNLWLTDHDRKLTGQEGFIYTPIGGLDPTAVRSGGGVEEQSRDVIAALSSEAITFDDLRARLWDECEIRERVVDWLYPWAGYLQEARYWITETTFDRERVTCQISTIPYWLRFNTGGLYVRNCDDDLGGPKCKVNLTPHQQGGSVATVTTPRLTFTASGINSTTDGDHNDGDIQWLSGANAGLTSRIRTYLNLPRTFSLNLQTPFPIVPGDDFLMTTGCERTVAACNDKFANIDNYPGKPDVPGTDELLRVTRK